MAQFLQYTTPPASTSHEATQSTGNLSPASTEHYLEQPLLSITAATNFTTVPVPPGLTTVTATTSQPAFTRQASSLPAAFTFNIQAPPPIAHGATTAVAPSYSDTVQPLIPALLPPAMPTTGWTIHEPPYHQLTTQPTVHPKATDALPPVSTQICQKIIQGEFIDFSVLLHRAIFRDATTDPLPSTQQPIKKISSNVMWMQVWNLYLLVILSHNHAKILEMIPYQCLICSATALLPLQSWLRYDAKFCTLAAANPLLCWDQRHPDLWLECLALGNKEQQHWPCPYCKVTTHFPENCPQSPFRHNKTPTPPEPGRSLLPIRGEFNQGHCTRATCKYRHISLSCQANHPRISCLKNQSGFTR